MERKQSPPSSSSPCRRPHSSFDLRTPPPNRNHSHPTPYARSQALSFPIVNLGNPIDRPRFGEAAVMNPIPKEGPRSADHSAPNIPSEGALTSCSSTKALLYELCAAYKWKPPLFDCLKDDGPSRLRRFTFKVVLEIRAGKETTVVEAFGKHKPSKKSAAEDAAEGALWYPKHLGYFPKKK